MHVGTIQLLSDSNSTLCNTILHTEITQHVANEGMRANGKQS